MYIYIINPQIYKANTHNDSFQSTPEMSKFRPKPNPNHKPNYNRNSNPRF